MKENIVEGMKTKMCRWHEHEKIIKTAVTSVYHSSAIRLLAWCRPYDEVGDGATGMRAKVWGVKCDESEFAAVFILPSPVKGVS